MTLQILVVEDNALSRDLAQSVLEISGHEVSVATSA